MVVFSKVIALFSISTKTPRTSPRGGGTFFQVRGFSEMSLVSYAFVIAHMARK